MHARTHTHTHTHTQMLNLDLQGNGDGRLSPVKQDAIHLALEGLGEPKKLFIQLCLQDDPGSRPKALSLLKHHVLQEVGGLEWVVRTEGKEEEKTTNIS